MTQLMQAMILGFWISAAVVMIAATKLVSCHYGNGLDSCGTLPYLAFFLGTFAIVGTLPFALVDLLNWDTPTEDIE